MNRINRRNFLRRSAAGFAAAGLAPILDRFEASGATSENPNILWLVAEDMCLDLGCYGKDLVHTPHLDQLAREGVRFTNACATSPVCSPSRSAFTTGMQQTSIGAHHHRSHLEDGYTLPGNVRVFTDYLHDNGYFTALMGWKLKTDFNFKPKVEPFSAREPGDSTAFGAYAHGAPDKPILSGEAWQKRPDDAPAFAQINFSEAHRTFAHDPDHPVDPADVEVPPQYPDHPITRMDWALYLETINNLDKKVGHVLREIDRRGLRENTLVIFFGDHGRPMLWGKQWLYDGGIHVPMIMRWPGKLEEGAVRDDPVSLIDLAPTTLDAVGIQPPEYMEGHVIIGERAEPREYVYAARDRCDETDDRIRAVRTSRYKYIRNFRPQKPYTQFNAYKKLQYPVLTLMEILHEKGELTPEQERFMHKTRPPEELYDLRDDPHEVNNLATEPEYREVLEELRGELDDWICRTGDDGQIPEDPETARYWDQYFEEHFRSTMEKRGLSPDISNEDYLDWWREQLEALKKGESTDI